MTVPRIRQSAALRMGMLRTGMGQRKSLNRRGSWHHLRRLTWMIGSHPRPLLAAVGSHRKSSRKKACWMPHRTATASPDPGLQRLWTPLQERPAGSGRRCLAEECSRQRFQVAAACQRKTALLWTERCCPLKPARTRTVLRRKLQGLESVPQVHQASCQRGWHHRRTSSAYPRTCCQAWQKCSRRQT